VKESETHNPSPVDRYDQAETKSSPTGEEHQTLTSSESPKPSKKLRTERERVVVVPRENTHQNTERYTTETVTTQGGPHMLYVESSHTLHKWDHVGYSYPDAGRLSTKNKI